jgi:cell wall-associated NlpC family hydrolase
MTEAQERQAVVDAAMGWLRTPYHHNARVKGAGVDCAQLPAAVYEEAGIISHIEPDYPSDWHLHRSEELYIQWVDQVGGKPIAVEDAGPGDFIIWRFGRTFSHGAIFVAPPQIIHAWQLDQWSDIEELARRERLAFTFWPRSV